MDGWVGEFHWTVLIPWNRSQLNKQNQGSKDTVRSQVLMKDQLTVCWWMDLFDSTCEVLSMSKHWPPWPPRVKRPLPDNASLLPRQHNTGFFTRSLPCFYFWLEWYFIRFDQNRRQSWWLSTLNTQSSSTAHIHIRVRGFGFKSQPLCRLKVLHKTTWNDICEKSLSTLTVYSCESTRV